jgi:hypothetical protein
MSAAHSGKFSKTHFKKAGFAAAGPEPSDSEARGTERSCVGPSQRVVRLETPGYLRTQLLTCRGRGSHMERSLLTPLQPNARHYYQR